jgi:putative cardiolipin synthase
MTTQLERWIEPCVTANGGQSGFRLLHRGLDAFVARASLIELAERTLDLQYYIFHADTTGSIIVDLLIAAADRGVRVRILLDDFGTAEKKDEAVAALDAHPNIEIRLFNPYVHRSRLGKLAEMVTSFARINRRMHNKQLIADGQAVVLGGRNIGDEYFGFGALDFQDVDVLAAGPIAGESLASFEEYWNSKYAVPVAELGKYTITPEAFATAREELRDRVEGLRDCNYAMALRASQIAQSLQSGDLQMHWAESTLIADPPEKLSRPAGTRDETYLGARISPHVEAVRKELLVVSPYFVPGKRGVDFFGGKRQSGVTVRILTNSLAATDVWLVHAGYQKYRRPLLERGVRLYELKPETQGAAGISGLVGSSHASLHGKTFVLDRTSVFIGSVNIDSRSLEQNTEVGVLVNSPALAAEVAALFERWAGAALSYEVRIGAANGRRGRLEWIGILEGKPVQFRNEPQASFGRRLGANVFSLLPIESLI